MAKKRIILRRAQVPTRDEYRKLLPIEKDKVDQDVRRDLTWFSQNLPPRGDEEGRLQIFYALYEYLAPIFSDIQTMSTNYQSALSKNVDDRTVAEQKLVRSKRSKFKIDKLPEGWDYSIVLKLLRPFGVKIGIRLSRIITQLKQKRFYTSFSDYLISFAGGISRNEAKKRLKEELRTEGMNQEIGGTIVQRQITDFDEQEQEERTERPDLIRSRLEMYVKLRRLTPNQRMALMLLDKGKLLPTDPDMTKAQQYAQIGINRRADYLSLLEKISERLEPELSGKEKQMYNSFLQLGDDKLAAFLRLN